MVECELCGKPISRKSYKISIEGVVLNVCEKCYSRHAKFKISVNRTYQRKDFPKPQQRIFKPKKAKRQFPELEYEVVEDFAEKIRKAREKLGWSTEVLAQKVREKETVIRRIESGRLTPTLDLARKLEKVLKISLLEPVIEEHQIRSKDNKDLTLGDIVIIRKKKGGI